MSSLHLVLNIAVGLVDTESELLLPVVRVCRGQGVQVQLLVPDWRIPSTVNSSFLTMVGRGEMFISVSWCIVQIRSEVVFLCPLSLVFSVFSQSSILMVAVVGMVG